MSETGGRKSFRRSRSGWRHGRWRKPGTLTYWWFGPDHGSYLVIEQYADTTAALIHNERSADLLARVASIAELRSAELYATLGPELLAWLSARPRVTAYPDLPGSHDHLPGLA